MALTKVKLIADGVITSANLDASHGITTSDIGEGSNLYYTDSRVSSYLSTNGFATQTDIVAAITDSAPVTLDTLNELAAALGDDPNFATTTANSIGTKMPLAGGTFTGNITLNDSVKARFGAGNDLDIYSDGTDGYVIANVDDLVLRSADDIFMEVNSGANALIARGGGAVEIYHNNSKKFETTSAGVTVTGNSTFAGNVGIGITSPTKTLDIRTDDGVLIKGATGATNGSLSFLPASGGRQYDLGNNGSNFQIKDISADIIRMFFHYNGRLAIGDGLTDPLGKIDIYRAAGGSGTAAIAITNGESNGKNWGISTEVIGGGDFALLQSSSTGGTPTPSAANVKFIINNAGNIGFGGQTSPSFPLDGSRLRLKFDSNTDHLTIQNTATTTSAIGYEKKIAFQGYNNVEEAAIVALGNQYYGGGENALVFKVSTTEAMRIANGSFVAINGTIDYAVRFRIYNNNSGSVTRALSITSSQYSGVHAEFKGSAGVTGSISYSGTSTSYNTSSDYRLKEDYQDFNGLDMVSNIPVYDFKWKSAEERSFGVKAHELQNILPQAVNGEKDAEEMQGVDYSKLTPILLKAIQELKADNDSLRERIQTLENQ